MNKIMFSAFVAMSAAVCLGKMVSPEEHAAKIGGILSRPDSQKGSVSFIDTQKRADITQPLEEILGLFRRVVPINMKTAKAVPGNPLEIKQKCGNEFAVIIVDDATAPSTAIYPDDGYAVVNTAKYDVGLKLPADKKIFDHRVAKGVMRAFVLLTNGGGSRYPANVAVAHRVQELDFTHDKIPIDIQNAMKQYLEKAGVTPLRRVPYRKAVEEGWAPAPTNDVQKAIWDKVHAMPTEPIKIKPETKKVEK